MLLVIKKTFIWNLDEMNEQLNLNIDQQVGYGAVSIRELMKRIQG